MTILLILVLIMLVVELKGLKTLFVPAETRKEQFIKEIKSQEDWMQGLIMIGIMFLCAAYVFTYILSIIYLGSFINTLVSLILILISLRSCYKGIQCIYMPDEINPDKFLWRLTIKSLNLVYIGYVIYWIANHY